MEDLLLQVKNELVDYDDQFEEKLDVSSESEPSQSILDVS